MRETRRGVCSAVAAFLLLGASHSLAAGPSTTRVSVSWTGQEADQGNCNIWGQAVDAAGKHVVFDAAGLLVPGQQGSEGVFVRTLPDVGDIARADASSTGEEANDLSGEAVISGDGGTVAFSSYATNLDPEVEGAGSDWQIFVHILSTGQTKLVSRYLPHQAWPGPAQRPTLSTDGSKVAFMAAPRTTWMDQAFVRRLRDPAPTLASVSDRGEMADAPVFFPMVSGNGRYVVFDTQATNLDPTDTNGMTDVYLRDLVARRTIRVSTPLLPGGVGGGTQPTISADGRYVAFSSLASDLVPDDTNGVPDVFVWDRLKRSITLASLSSGGRQGDGPSGWGDYLATPHISPDGRFVEFDSFADNLVPDDTNGIQDVFVRDLATRLTTRVTVSTTGEQADFELNYPCGIASGGAVALFESDADNLVHDDTNSRTDVFLRG